MSRRQSPVSPAVVVPTEPASETRLKVTTESLPRPRNVVFTVDEYVGYLHANLTEARTEMTRLLVALQSLQGERELDTHDAALVRKGEQAYLDATRCMTSVAETADAMRNEYGDRDEVTT